MKTILNLLNSIWNFIKNHMIWSALILCFILCFADGFKTNEYNIAGYACVFGALVALLAPFIRNQRIKKQRKEENEYLAKQIALEQDKIAHPEKYINDNN